MVCSSTNLCYSTKVLKSLEKMVADSSLSLGGTMQSVQIQFGRNKMGKRKSCYWQRWREFTVREAASRGTIQECVSLDASEYDRLSKSPEEWR